MRVCLKSELARERTADAVNEDVIGHVKAYGRVQGQSTALEQLLKLVGLDQVSGISVKHESILLDLLARINGARNQSQNSVVVDELSCL